jgi:hypothetical protein
MLPDAISAEYMRSSGGGPLKAGWLSAESSTIKVCTLRAELSAPGLHAAWLMGGGQGLARVLLRALAEGGTSDDRAAPRVLRGGGLRAPEGKQHHLSSVTSVIICHE